MSKKTPYLLLIAMLMTTVVGNLAMAEELPPSMTGTDETAQSSESTDSTTDSYTEESTAATAPAESTSTTDSNSVTATESLETTEAATTESDNSSTASPEKAFTDFNDVSVDHPYYNPIIVLRYQGLLKGYADNTFRPDQPLNRVEALKLVFEVAKIDLANGIAPAEFTDTEPMAWYSGYLNKAVYLEVVSGYADGSFKPSQSVNLVEFLKMLLLTQKADLSNVNLNQLPYADVMPGQWYSKYVNYSKINELIGTAEDNKIFPGEALTRARAADIIYRFRNMKAKPVLDNDSSSSSGSTATIIPVKDYALFVSASNKFAVQYPKIWFYSAFVEKPDPADLAVYGFGPDDLSVNAPLVTLEILPDDSAFATNLIDNAFLYLREEGDGGVVKLSAKIDGSSRIYRLSGQADQEANMLTMLKSLTTAIDGLESYNPAEPAESEITTETTIEATETEETTETATETTTETTTEPETTP